MVQNMSTNMPNNISIDVESISLNNPSTLTTNNKPPSKKGKKGAGGVSGSQISTKTS